MSPWEAIIEKVPEGCRTLLAAAAALAMTMMATMLALTADAHVLALVDDLLRENVQRLDLLGRQGRQDAIGYLGLRGAALLGQRIAFRRNAHGIGALASYSELGVELLATHLVLHRSGHVFGTAVGQQSAHAVHPLPVLVEHADQGVDLRRQGPFGLPGPEVS